MKKFRSLICFILILVSVLTLNTTKCLAATVGDQLTSPESGWQRYDDNNPLIVYSNFDYPRYPGSGRYNNTLSYSNNLQSKISFAFYGTKLRIIGELAAAPWRSTVKITIDGSSYSYSEVSQTGGMKQGLEFEIYDLEKKIHNVTIEKISTDSNSSLTLDAIDIDADGSLLDKNYPIYLEAASDKVKVDLIWTSVSGVTSYIVKRSTVSDSGYQIIASLSQKIYIDTDVQNDTTYYYMITAVVDGIETANSNEASVTIHNDPIPTDKGNKAILEVVMTNGTIKEYDLTVDELDNYLTWYDNRSDGMGKSYFKLPKKSNVKPFLSRNEYLSYDKIYSFEVKDYNE